jgi:hypothetical protein
VKYKKLYRLISSETPGDSQYDPDVLSLEIAAQFHPSSGDYVASLANPHRFKQWYFQESFLSKLPRSGVPAEKRESKAIDTLLESEDACSRVNEHGYDTSTPAFFFESVMAQASYEVSRILGPLTYDLFKAARFTSGATTSRRNRQGDAYFKYHATWNLDVTSRAAPYLKALIGNTPIWAREAGLLDFNIVPGNRVTTVPKKTDTDRAIAMEPDGNVLLQNAIGRFLQRRLKKFGVNLRDQTTNRDFARLGSATGIVATLDLKAASDSISDRLVWDLLPPDWYNLLDAVRSHYGTLPKSRGGKLIKWSKFSAMGNGFTFELESLLFYAISLAVAKVIDKEDDDSKAFISVYGDDIICPTRVARPLTAVLNDLGFAVNKEKSFVTGVYFRESCGGHYYKGVDVTPIYLRKPIDRLSRKVWLLNSIRKWSYVESVDLCDPTLSSWWFSFRRAHVPRHLLGGVQVESTTSVWSPHLPRAKIVFRRIDSTSLKGWRSLLRWFQNNQTGDSDHPPSLAPRKPEPEWEFVHNTERFLDLDNSSSSELVWRTDVVSGFSRNCDLPELGSVCRDYRFPTEVAHGILS